MSYEVTYIDEVGNVKTERVYDVSYIENKGEIISVKKKFSFSLSRKASSEEKCTVLEAVADLLDVGVGLAKAFEHVAYTIESERLKKVLFEIVEELEKGVVFSEVIARYRSVLGETITEMLVSGYETGRLSEAMRLAVQYEVEIMNVKREFFSRMSYPIFVFILGLLGLFFQAYFVVPKLLDTGFLKGKENLAVHILGIVVKVIPWLVVGFIVSLVILSVFILADRQRSERVFMRIPILREFLVYRGLFITFFSLSKLLSGGVRLRSALSIVANMVSGIVKEDIQRSIEYLERGENFVKGFSILSQVEKAMLMTSFSEEKIGYAFEKVANRYKNAYFKKMRKLAPIAYAFVFAMVLGIFMLVFMAVIVPYLENIKNIMTGKF